MADIMDYIRWRGDLSFTQDPPNEVDALIFSTLSYIRYGGDVESTPSDPVLLRDAAHSYFSLEDYEDRIRVKNDLELLRQAAACPRYGLSRIIRYSDIFIPEQETQFAAMTFLLDDGSAFVAFRGTDYSLVGWKEDFNMSFQQTVPSQRLAVQYIHSLAMDYAGPLRLAGHSKGGNLAVFAAARSAPWIRERILDVYNNDGPGFTEYMMGDPGYLEMVPRIHTYIPQSSVIGMLLGHEEPYRVIRSRNVSLLQHDPYSWEVMGKHFEEMDEVSANSRFVDATIKTWFAEMTNRERNQLVDAMFALLSTGGVDNALEIFHPRNIRNYLKTLSTDENMRRILSTEFQGLMEAARQVRARMDE